MTTKVKFHKHTKRKGDQGSPRCVPDKKSQEPSYKWPVMPLIVNTEVNSYPHQQLEDCAKMKSANQPDVIRRRVQ